MIGTERKPMTRRIPILALILMLLGAITLLAHNETRIVGVITKVQPTKLEVKRKDGRTFLMEIDKETSVTRDQKKVDLSALKVGQSVIVTACGEPKDLLALEVRIVQAATTPAPK